MSTTVISGAPSISHQKAADIQRAILDRFFLSTTLADMAGIRTRSGLEDDISQAEKDLREAADLRLAIGAPVVEILCKTALFYLEKHTYLREPKSPSTVDEEKAAHCRRTAEQQVKPNHVNDLMFLSYVKGRYLQTGHPQRAKEEFARLEQLSKDAGSLKFAFLAQVGLGRADEGLKLWLEAGQAYEKAVAYAEQIRETLDPRARLLFLQGEEVLGVKHVLPYRGTGPRPNPRRGPQRGLQSNREHEGPVVCRQTGGWFHYRQIGRCRYCPQGPG